jgi:hypothetical protein
MDCGAKADDTASKDKIKKDFMKEIYLGVHSIYNTTISNCSRKKNFVFYLLFYAIYGSWGD